MAQKQNQNWVTRGCAVLGVIFIVCFFIFILATFLGFVEPVQPAPLPHGW